MRVRVVCVSEVTQCDAQPLVDADMTLDPCYAAGERVDGSYKLQEKHGAVAKLPGFREGLFWVQDPAATAVADLVPIPEDGRVLDACGAPGGKALRLACRGAQVTAIDRSGERLALIKENHAIYDEIIALRADA